MKNKVFSCLLFISALSWFSLTQAVSQTTTANDNLIYTDAAVVSFAQNTTQIVFNYNYQNYEQQLKLAAQNFTPPGWQAYLKALTDSKNIGAMSVHKLTMTSKITGHAVITNKQTVNNLPFWTVEMPVQIIYTDPNKQQLIHQVLVKLLITINNNPKGLGVAQLIATPVKQP